ncbi:arabinose-5-phosphate isomerase [Bathymodiolus platifrons methanotrophic gill symbiont]|uniref:KpsF/GutQ family sugar-phosphate isomerase n=1 Tax=Bathymodiolus platifrons methanotrophic gill symbiont TaxID=113268 RepID=UPI000B40EB0B|nr:KpsF/GutQ family sugar-phosphate isomerase [Bathymodiolus platifrons methanotrophic gill symbiont]GAW86616.1 arabinose-5-phosphate isomerase [Bathymodiolus platifrons methanotrophic gill symbiont]GFO74509.1 arabinose-5-phosphate isomerase [Bathymodiolus platifrons methanotrophic gill symbiont]
MNDRQLIQTATEVITLEAQAVNGLLSTVDEDFVRACHIIAACKGRVVVTGMGKSGHIAGKIAATLASTGTPAFFVHPGEASHGDLGMITRQDVVLALSNSGETEEILTLLPIIKRLAVPMIAMTGRVDSTLAKFSSAHLSNAVEKEACSLGLAPTASTTAALVMGDALAVTLMTLRGFTRDDFALSHPGGSLGRRLLVLVRDIMHTGKQLPVVKSDVSIMDALVEMTAKKLGMTAVVDSEGQFAGVFTDGDVRRLLERNIDIQQALLAEVMTVNCQVIGEEVLAAEAMQIMEEKKINALLVVDTDRQVTGALNMHDLIHAGIV